MAQLVGALSHISRDCRFNSQSGYIPRLWVPTLVGASTEGNRSMFLSQINFLKNRKKMRADTSPMKLYSDKYACEKVLSILVIRKMQIKTTMRCQYLLIRMVYNNFLSKYQVLARMQNNENSQKLLI